VLVLVYWPTMGKTVPWFTWIGDQVTPLGRDLFYESPQANSVTDATPEATHQRVQYEGFAVVEGFQWRTCQLAAKQEKWAAMTKPRPCPHRASPNFLESTASPPVSLKKKLIGKRPNCCGPGWVGALAQMISP
jgi:hypothetical protein